ncbi:glycosyltransferase family 4 protein [Pseudooceanicola aestuarii]|uniref:glycosyltransferase family 4 protein n=1 Tax=Pseudooceanicola aestuarii TaxID=2697319 RepID=UPI0013D40242|nr:glycosyltransferase family 4 protein [Pseudooceanicola aestuarii]
MPELFVTNFNPKFTGVSATAANVLKAQMQRHDLALVGHPLPGAPDPISRAGARRLSRRPSGDRSFAIWHVRRDPEMISALWARDVLRLPIRIVFTSAAKHRHSAFPRWLIARMDAVIATSPEAAAFFPDVAATASHGVDLSRYAPAPDRAAAWRALGYGGDRGVAIIGRVRPEKGTDIFVDAMIRRMQTDERTTALVVGLAKDKDQPFLAELKSRVTQAGLEGRILFLGFIDHDLQTRLMPALSLVVNVARYEPFGIVPVEGMGAGTPFVCSDTGYYREFSHQESCGLIVPPGDPDAAAQAVGALLDDPDRHAAMARAARDAAVAHHSIEREADAISDVYERLWAGQDLAVHR